ncbi:response regulator transcription factor [Foetidibacter luteolus]|uniref:response regulator transcription factor n=1 Tax=Foetidibacter luteolus TaxID=2608880 RepID=UPI00129B4C18|nr:response regulator transcription factor [Foetidibacter luteolus]
MSTKILYVEDEVFLGKVVKESLETRGYEVVMEADGANVLPVFRKINPDICVLDVMLPNKNGFELAEEIRRINHDLPLIFLTAKTQTQDVVRGFQSGGNDFIRKPFSMEELIVRIENALRNKKSAAPQPVPDNGIALGAYTLNLKRQVLQCGSEEKKLSFREAELLKYLWQNRNHIIDRRNMLNAIWGNDSFFNSRNLDVYITKLRGYLKDDPAIEILTIKGVGYRFVC